jgi:hypothetical protein
MRIRSGLLRSDGHESVTPQIRFQTLFAVAALGMGTDLATTLSKNR